MNPGGIGEIGFPCPTPIDPGELKESFDVGGALLFKAKEEFAGIIPEFSMAELV